LSNVTFPREPDLPYPLPKSTPPAFPLKTHAPSEYPPKMSFFPTSRVVLTRHALLPVSRSTLLLRCKGTAGSPPPGSPNKSVATATPAANTAAAFPEAGSEVPSDISTSAYSPVNLFPAQRGENEALDAASISGAPLDLQARTVKIYKPSKPATQSGNWNGRQWRMDWDILPKGHRWENPLMGWQSSGDFMQGTHIFFKSKEDAVINGSSRSPTKGPLGPRLMLQISS
ncbi:hypothetical protein C7212DRAFT_319736, partial [Tuber magnatum]